MLNRQLLEEASEQWTDDAIRTRTQQLADVISRSKGVREERRHDGYRRVGLSRRAAHVAFDATVALPPRAMTLPNKLPAGFVVPAQPVERDAPPSGADWVHMLVRRDGEHVRLFCRKAIDWTTRRPSPRAPRS
jgi:hypothetical protein